MTSRKELATMALRITEDVRLANEDPPSLAVHRGPVGFDSLTTAVECLAKALLEPEDEC